MMLALQIGTFLVLFGYFLASIVRLLRTRRLASAHLLCMVHFALCGVPLLLDLLIGLPKFWPRVASAAEDPATNYVYNFYIALCPIIWWHWGQPKRPQHDDAELDEGLRRFRLPLVLLLVSPAIFVWFTPDPSAYSKYAVSLEQSSFAGISDAHIYLSGFCLMSVLAATGLLLCARRMTLMLALVMPFVGVSCWLFGKRTIVLLTLVTIGLALVHRKYLRGRKLAFVMTAAIAGFGLYSYDYQTKLRGLGEMSSHDRYDNFRLDYGRDHTIRMALYSEIHSDEVAPVLDYPGQNLVFYATALIPRRTWAGKPWPYAVYMTAAALNVPRTSLGWGLTTSWLDECVSSFGLLGCLIAPITLAWFCRFGDSQAGVFTAILTHICAALFLAVEPIAFVWLLLLWVFTVAITMSHGKLIKRKLQAQPCWQASSAFTGRLPLRQRSAGW